MCTVMLLNCVGVDCSMTLFLPANYTIYLSILQLLLIQTLPFSYPLFPSVSTFGHCTFLKQYNVLHRYMAKQIT